MTRALAIARIVLYAAVALAAAFAPDLPRAIALVPSAHPATAPMLVDDASATLGWATRFAASGLAHVCGFSGLAFGTALAVTGTMALVEWRARRVASPGAALAAATLVAACSLDAAHVGGGAINGLFFAALTVAFILPGTAGIAAIAVVTAAWCNASPAGVLAPIFVIANAIGSVVERGDKAERTHAQVAVVFSALAMLATPAFAAFPLVAWRAIDLDGNINDLAATSPYVTATLGYQVGVFCTIVLSLAIGARTVRAGAAVVFAVAAYLAFCKGAFVPMLGIAAAPILAEAAARRWPIARALAFDGRALAFALAGTAVPLALVAGVVSARTLPTLAAARSGSPFGAIAVLAREPASHGRLLCTRLSWCDVAERYGSIRVLADSRIASASVATIELQRTIAGAKHGWVEKARASGVGAIFVDERSGFSTLLRADGWRSLASDGTGIIFVRDAAR